MQSLHCLFGFPMLAGPNFSLCCGSSLSSSHVDTSVVLSTLSSLHPDCAISILSIFVFQIYLSICTSVTSRFFLVLSSARSHQFHSVLSGFIRWMSFLTPTVPNFSELGAGISYDWLPLSVTGFLLLQEPVVC